MDNDTNLKSIVDQHFINKLREEKQCRKGLLIDFDYAATLEKAADTTLSKAATALHNAALSKETLSNAGLTNPKNPGVRTRTAPFMALDLLLHASPHTVAHDLESLFYVILFICTNLKGPNMQIRQNGVFGKGTVIPMAQWFSEDGSFHELGLLKQVHPFGLYLRQLRFAVFPPKGLPQDFSAQVVLDWEREATTRPKSPGS